MNPSLYDPDARVVFFPVRHHSPACARLVIELARTMRPDAILIEGPADFNDHLSELWLPHRLPIAIYSYSRTPDGKRRGAFYPFCVYSPEWQAIQIGRELGAAVSFIDMPWALMAQQAETPQRYSDSQLSSGSYVQHLCHELGVDTFDDAWDTLFEIAPLTVAGYLERAHQLCAFIRQAELHVAEVDVQRETYMAANIQAAMERHSGRILVITGGFHSSALFARLYENGGRPILLPTIPQDVDRGIALTPYSYERLDSLKGYESGMPNPGFYHQAWGEAQQPHRKLLAMVAQMLRGRAQPVSAADLIAIESTAHALATLRGHERVWRRDIVDGVISGLIKDELAYQGRHPFLEAVFEVFRGKERGHLAAGTALPPLVVQIQLQLDVNSLTPTATPRPISLQLSEAADASRNRILHQLRVLAVPGFQLTAPYDPDNDQLTETWRIVWSPEFEAACIEAAIYGTTLEDAAFARLLEQVQGVEHPNAARAVKFLLDAVLIGMPAGTLFGRLADLIGQDNDFFTVTQALANLLYLYRFDTVLGTVGTLDVGNLLRTTFSRSLWLLETLGTPTGKDPELLRGIRAILETFERCAAVLNVEHSDLASVFDRLLRDRAQLPLVRGSAIGVLWTLDSHLMVTPSLQDFANPAELGDFLAGLFFVAREIVQRDPALIGKIDELLLNFDDEGFLAALPSLRLAFLFFVPREKYYLTRTLFEGQPPLPALEVGVEQMARVLAFENALFKAMERYGIIEHG